MGRYRRDPEFRMFIRKIFGLGFLPVHYVRRAFDAIEGSDEALRYGCLETFLSYFRATWLERIDIAIWNVFAREHHLRTTNSIEGWHNR